MSTDSYDEDCPRYGAKDALVNVSDRQFPWPEHYGYCLECGFHYDTFEGVHDLGEVNEMRAEEERPPLTSLAPVLPEWKYA
jgi:hypothetical protein